MMWLKFESINTQTFIKQKSRSLEALKISKFLNSLSLSLSLSHTHTHTHTHTDTSTSIPHGSNKRTPTSSNLRKPNYYSQYWWWWNQRAYPRNYSLFPIVWTSGRINIIIMLSFQKKKKKLLIFQFKMNIPCPNYTEVPVCCIQNACTILIPR